MSECFFIAHPSHQPSKLRFCIQSAPLAPSQRVHARHFAGQIRPSPRIRLPIHLHLTPSLSFSPRPLFLHTRSCHMPRPGCGGRCPSTPHGLHLDSAARAQGGGPARTGTLRLLRRVDGCRRDRAWEVRLGGATRRSDSDGRLGGAARMGAVGPCRALCCGPDRAGPEAAERSLILTKRGARSRD